MAQVIWLSASLFAATALGFQQAAAQSKQCLEMDCFNERQVRDFEVIDRDTMVIYVGRERCAYKVKVDTLYCDLTFLPEVEFYDRRRRDINDRMRGGDPRTDVFGRRDAPGSFNERVCTYSQALALETFNFAETMADAPIGRAACEVLDISTITDDELLEVYVAEGVLPPPPPVGNGELSRSQEQPEGLELDVEEEGATPAAD